VVKKESSGFETFDEFLQRLDSGATKIKEATDNGIDKFAEIEQHITTKSIVDAFLFIGLLIIYIPAYIAYILVRKRK
jgi:hypothetical protein